MICLEAEHRICLWAPVCGYVGLWQMDDWIRTYRCHYDATINFDSHIKAEILHVAEYCPCYILKIFVLW